jgi:hypothetical protein
MSVGLYNHSLFGPVKKTIHNNKRAIELTFSSESTEEWAKKHNDLMDKVFNNQM